MDYEQKYKEALKVIGSLYNVVKYQSSSDALLASQTIEKAFPELKESEDERIRKEITEYITRHNDCITDKEYTWISWLKKQGEQNPAWSEEDERILKRIDNLLYSHCQIRGSLYEELHNWLKSMKPNHWKPSDEQMQALETAIKCRTMPWEQLWTLYKDLKKL